MKLAVFILIAASLAGQDLQNDALLRVRTTIERSGGRIVGAVLNKDSSDGGIKLRRDRYAYEKVASQA